MRQLLAKLTAAWKNAAKTHHHQAHPSIQMLSHETPQFTNIGFLKQIWLTAKPNCPKKTENIFFLDLVPFLLDLDTFHGPYYKSFGDGYPSFGPAHPPAGPGPSQTIPPLDRFSKLHLDRNSSNSATWQEAFQYIVWLSASFPFCLLLNFYFSHLSRPWAFIWFQYLNFPPLCLSAISGFHSLGLNKTAPPAS